MAVLHPSQGDLSHPLLYVENEKESKGTTETIEHIASDMMYESSTSLKNSDLCSE